MMDRFELSPDTASRPKIIRFFQVLLGLAGIITSIAWVIITLTRGDSNLSVWLTILFLSAFGTYMIMAGLGKDTRYVEVRLDSIGLKQNAFLPPEKLHASDLEKIRIHPLSIEFLCRNNKISRLRFGISYPEIIEPIKSRIVMFGESINVPVEIIEDAF